MDQTQLQPIIAQAEKEALLDQDEAETFKAIGRVNVVYLPHLEKYGVIGATADLRFLFRLQAFDSTSI